jgi:ubiquinone/menaquinone biosynthesis C-methylase UbiE
MRLGKSAKIFGIDPWEVAIRRAEKKIAFYEIENVRLIKGVAENIPLGNESIDLITSNNGLNNVSDIHQSLKECSRILSKEGQFVQTMNLDETMIEFYNAFRSVLQEMKLIGEIDKMKAQIYKKRKPLDEYLALLETNNFKVENVVHDRFEYKFVDGTTMFNHYFIRLDFLNGWMEIVPEELRKEVFEKTEMKINEKSETDGYFKLSIPFVLIDCTKKK